MPKYFRLSMIALLVGVGFFVCNYSHAGQFVPLGDLPGGDYTSTATAISDNGNYIVGLSTETDFPTDFTPVRWSAGGALMPLSNLTRGIFPNSVSNDGELITGYKDHEGAVIWTAITGFLPVSDGPANMELNSVGDMTADGSIFVGTVKKGVTGSFPEAYRWGRTTEVVGLGDLQGGHEVSGAASVSADGNAIAGISNSKNGIEAFRWTERTGMVGLGDLLGGQTSSYAYNISANGKVVVGDSSSGLGSQAFRWTEKGGMQGIGFLPGTNNSVARSVSGDGAIAVGSSGGAFVWDEQHGMRELQQVLIDEYGMGSQLEGWELRNANDISADGLSIIGGGKNPDGNFEAWLVRLDHPIGVPEPSTLLLATLGIAGWLGRRAWRSV